MPMLGFEPAIPASERPQTLTLDSSTTGIGTGSDIMHSKYSFICDP